MGESGRVTCEGGEGVMEGGKVEGMLQCDPSQRESIDKLIQNPIISEFRCIISNLFRIVEISQEWF